MPTSSDVAIGLDGLPLQNRPSRLPPAVPFENYQLEDYEVGHYGDVRFAAIGTSAAGADNIETCVVEDAHDACQTTCYVDSVNGNDSNDGLSEAVPVKSQSAIHSSCTVVCFKRGSVFNEKPVQGM